MGSLSSILKSDLNRIERIEKSFFANFLKWYFLPQGSTFPYIVWYRVLQYCRKKRLLKFTIGIFVYFIYRHYTFKYGIHMSANMEVGKGLFIVHGDGVYINCRKIGENFTIYQNTTLGAFDLNNRICPEVGDNVTVYTVGVVIGDVCLNNGCVVGANAFVNKSVNVNTVVAGIPATEIGKIKNEKN